ncbi:MAG: hypothetical protein ACI9L6_001108 [Flavobacterium sp.]|jgi:hypothetical protein
MKQRFVYWKIIVNLQTQNNSVKTKSYSEFIPFPLNEKPQNKL